MSDVAELLNAAGRSDPRAARAAKRASGADVDARGVACPVDPVKGCIQCHMPKVEGMVPHARFTDHRIRVLRRVADGR